MRKTKSQSCFFRLFFFLANALLCAQLLHAERVEHLGCYAEWSDNTLTVGNELVERQWRIEAQGLLRPTSFYDKVAAAEWLRGASRQPAPYPVAAPSDEARSLRFTVEKGKLSPVEADSLILFAEAAGQDQTFHYRLQIYPQSAGISIKFSSNVPEAASTSDDQSTPRHPDGLENIPQESTTQNHYDAALEDLILEPAHLRYVQVELMDQTDYHDELVFEREWQTRLDVFNARCNLFHIEDLLTQNGLIFLKLAPLPHARPLADEWDVKVRSSARRVSFGGHGYPWTIIPYQQGRAGRILALQRYQRSLREYVPGRDGMLLSNTWGDRSRDARVTEDFLMQEIEAGARLGVDVIQVDDGWQKGKSGNSAFGKGAWEEFRSVDPDFWTPHPERFPNGLKPLVDAAAKKGMQFGLWFGPSAEESMK
ncbi:MAG: hypothetical protein GW893_24460, partial [Armatimonadetes bacterium]|nr:hypothetical protein [Armatimonadota bacterium]